MSIWKTIANEFKAFLIPLIVLLWKFKKQQFYRFRHAFWELFGSIILFVIIFLLHQLNISTPGFIIDSKPIKYIDSQRSLVRVFYEPFNNFTRRLMNETEKYLNQNSDPNQQWEFESISFPVIFHDDFFDTNNGIAQVKFKNQGSPTNDLDYSISVLSDVAKSNLDVAFHGVLTTISPKVELAPAYLGELQWAIDKSYIKQLTPRDIDTFVMMTAITDAVKDELLTIHRFMLICTILGPLPFFLVIASKMVDERRSGMKELMKQAGISSNMWRFAYYLEALIAAILYSSVVTTLLKVSNKPILGNSNAFIVGFTIAFHFVNSMCLAFISTSVCQNITYSDCLACIIYLMVFILEFLLKFFKEHMFIFYYVLPHAPIYMFWEEIFYLEKIGVGSQFENILLDYSEYGCRVSLVWIAFLVQQIITITLAWYLDQVRPGYYGIAKKLYFPFQKKYWCPINKRKLIILPPHLLLGRTESHFQKIPKNVEIAVQVLNVSKVFEATSPKMSVTALDSVSFDCCRGEVTVLLGANGAGKSTLLLIVAGMLSVTDGHVFVNGFQVGSRIMRHRHSLRICMQKDLCFSYLTVKENIMFFSKLKKTKQGFTVDHLLKKLKLLKISDHYGYNLSAGLNKSLQVACALVGDADVLLLDEPTTGMEIEVRLRLWDMLMVLRGNKTILMATSCLEEANALGDRIVLLDNGELRCHGSPQFIKNIIGTCFTLSIIIADSARLYDLKELVDSIIPDLECKIHDMTRIVFSLPASEFENFPTLLEVLEEQTKRLGIILLDVGMFMEEVFDKFVVTPVQEVTSNRRRSRSSSSDVVFCRNRIKGYKLKCKQTIMLTLRVFDGILTQKFHFLTLRFLLPVFCLVNVTLTSNYSLRNKRMFNEDMSMITPEIEKIVYNVAPTTLRSRLRHGVGKFPGVETVYLENIDDEFISAPEVHSVNKTVGFEITDDYIRIIHPIDPRLTSKTVNMFSNIYMSMYVPNHNNTIRTSYETLGKEKSKSFKDVKSAFLCLRWSSWVTFLSMFPLAPTIILCIKERKFGIRDNHMMAGCTPIIHWAARLIAHMIIFSIVIVIPFLIICVFMDFDRTFLQPKFLGSSIALLLMFGLAFHSYVYVWSFRKNLNDALCQIYITSLFFGVFLPSFLAVLEVFAKKIFYLVVPYYILEIFARLSPIYTFSTGMAKLTLRARLNAHCHLNKHMCPNLKFDDESFDLKICCDSTSDHEPFPYLASYETGIFEILTLFIQFVVYWTVVILLEYKIIQRIQEEIIFRSYKNHQPSPNDARSVLQERYFVKTALQKKNYFGFLVDDVHKYYTDSKFTKQKKNIYAVQGISYATKLGECLAILGTQSAGKTALMKMLAGNTIMTKGDASIQGTFLSRERMKYIHKVCLSLSTGGMDEFMTSLDNLVFVAKLRGYSERMAYFLAIKALSLMGIKANTITVSQYSSGSLRRLSLCNVLVLAPSVAILDEPMKEIDASGKLLVAKAMLHLKGEPAAVIVTDTAMDWSLMQQVYNRIAIMSKGLFATIGPAKQVLDSIATGYSARIKLKMVTAYRRDRYHGSADDDSDLDTEEDVAGHSEALHSSRSVKFAQTLVNFKADFLKAFQSSRLCSEHLCMLFFYIDDKDKTLRYSAMFQKLQTLKTEYHDLIEDYILSFSTVEDFLWTLEYDVGPDSDTQFKRKGLNPGSLV